MSALEQDEPIFETLGICHSCAHRRGLRSCDAFTEIPVEILVGDKDHRLPYPGDNGIRYQPKEITP
jgi:hypothetical protein